jgi:transcriptional regulator with XRE-family HTH domain
MKTKLKKIGEPLRKEQRLTQEDMARKIGVGKTTYRKWVHRYPSEKGGKPNSDNLEKVAQILGLPSKFFFDDLDLNR